MNSVRVPDDMVHFILTVGFYAACQAQADVAKNNVASRGLPITCIINEYDAIKS